MYFLQISEFVSALPNTPAKKLHKTQKIMQTGSYSNYLCITHSTEFSAELTCVKSDSRPIFGITALFCVLTLRRENQS